MHLEAIPVVRLTRRYDRIANFTDLPEITIRQAAGSQRG